jgi:hypothetical protein
MKRALLLLLSLLLAPAAFAWGEKGHYIVNEAATHGLPADMPHFFYQAFPDLIWLGFNPDRQRGGGSSLDDVNPPNHFLDYEFVANLKLPPDRYKFLDLLYTSGQLRRKGITNDESGFLPWVMAEEAQRLLVAFRLWRQSTPGSTERKIIERDVIHIAGTLGHFVADSSNPHHTTINYNGWVEPNPHGFAIDCGTHSRFERDFVSRAVDVKDVIPRLAPTPTLHEDFFATAMAQIHESNALVATLYTIDRDGGFQPTGPIRKEGFDFATSRLADGASLLRDLWWSAWVNSGKPARRGGD